MTDTKTNTKTEPRVIGGANIGGSAGGTFALVALVERADLGAHWLADMTRRFKEHNDAAILIDAENKARLTAREIAVTEREAEVEILMMELTTRSDAIRSIIAPPA